MSTATSNFYKNEESNTITPMKPKLLNPKQIQALITSSKNQEPLIKPKPKKMLLNQSGTLESDTKPIQLKRTIRPPLIVNRSSLNNSSLHQEQSMRPSSQ